MKYHLELRVWFKSMLEIRTLDFIINDIDTKNKQIQEQEVAKLE